MNIVSHQTTPYRASHLLTVYPPHPTVCETEIRSLDLSSSAITLVNNLPRHPGTNRPNLSDLLTNGVLDLIRERRLESGDRLPTARELAAHFAVATPTMREALRKLQATGVIDIRHGSGIYVLHSEQRLVVANPGYGNLETHTILQIIDTRLLIEPQLTELAARLIAPPDLDTLRALIEQAEDETQLHEYLATNVRFHTIVARASGNLVSAQIIESLIDLYSIELDLVDPNLSLVDSRTADNAVHRQIYEALATRNGASARIAMEHHLQTARQSVSVQLASERT